MVPGVRWCARADALFDVPGMHVLEVHREPDRLVLTVESDADVGGCPSCGVVAVGHGRRVVEAADAPCFGVPTRVRWRKRVWRCPAPQCPRRTFSEEHPVLASRAKLTARAIGWATDALAEDDTTVSAVARHLGVDWHTCWDAVEVEAQRRLADPTRLNGVRTIGVDEHVWRPSRIGDSHRAATAMVDLTRDADGCLHARLLDVVPGRSGRAYARWLQAQAEAFIAGIEHAALDPFRGYANALRNELPDAVAVLDAFHVVKLGTQLLDECVAACSRRASVGAATRTTRCTRSVGCCGAGASTCRTSRSTGSTRTWAREPRTGRSPRRLGCLPAAALHVHH